MGFLPSGSQIRVIFWVNQTFVRKNVALCRSHGVENGTYVLFEHLFDRRFPTKASQSRSVLGEIMTQLSQSQSASGLASAPRVRVISGAPLSTRSQSARGSQSRGGHLTARGRRLLATLTLIPLVTAMVLSGTHRASATGTAPTTRQIVVHAGESLWEISERIAPNADPRKTMWDIQQLNNMTTSRLESGQALIVPIR